MRNALTISAAAHILMWLPILWVSGQPLPAPAIESISVEIVSPEALEQARKAQEPDKASDPEVSTAQQAEPQPSASSQPQPSASSQPQQQGQQSAQNPAYGAQPTPPPEGGPLQVAQPAQTAPEAQAEVEPEEPRNWAGTWFDSPLMTASVGFETVPSAAKLSVRDIATFKARLRECWSPPAALASDQNLVVVLRVAFQPNGAVTGEPALLAASASANGAALMQTALRALRQCQPFAFLPAAKYKEWRTLELAFSPAGLSHLPKL